MRHFSGSQIRTTFSRNLHTTRERTILFVTCGEDIPDRLRYAIERELPWATIAVCDSVAAIAPSYRDMLALVVLAPQHLADIEQRAGEVLRFHPLALVAVMAGVHPLGAETIRQLQTSKIIRGVLPMQAKLDQLTPIIALMMRGGDYYPRHLVQDEQPAASPVEVVSALPRPSVKPSPDCLSYLTKRERQVLAMVSRGLQNKSIASDLNLSEHTVKIHLHNIITKLGTHNRTEAAAVYRDSGGSSIHLS
jgi:DNA-binding CsgD family transcriptional regulator